MRIINGKKIAKAIRNNIKQEIKASGIRPGLAAILIGNDPASRLYISLKEKASAKAGIVFEKITFPRGISEKEILKKIEELNGREDIHGIIVQLPLPDPLNEDKVIPTIDPKKDADGFHPENIASLLAGKEPFVFPGLPMGMIELIRSTGENIKARRALIIANSEIFLRPAAFLLEKEGATVETAFPEDEGLSEKCRKADILVVCVGRPHFIKAEMIKDGSIVIDVGTNRSEGKVVGDVDPAGTEKMDGWLTPVPGGVGPMTVAMLLKNTLEAAKKTR